MGDVLFQDEVAVFREDVVVVPVGFLVAVFFGAVGEEGGAFEGFGGSIERGRGEEDDFCAGGSAFFHEVVDPFAVVFEAFFAEGVVDAVVHSVAGENDIGFDFCEDFVEAGVDAGAGEGVIGFAVAAGGF